MLLPAWVSITTVRQNPNRYTLTFEIEPSLDFDCAVSHHPKENQYQERNIGINQRLFDRQLHQHVFFATPIAPYKGQRSSGPLIFATPEYLGFHFSELSSSSESISLAHWARYRVLSFVYFPFWTAGLPNRFCHLNHINYESQAI